VFLCHFWANQRGNSSRKEGIQHTSKTHKEGGKGLPAQKDLSIFVLLPGEDYLSPWMLWQSLFEELFCTENKNER
jgi:hypothetical protein